MHQVWSRYL